MFHKSPEGVQVNDLSKDNVMSETIIISPTVSKLNSTGK